MLKQLMKVDVEKELTRHHDLLQKTQEEILEKSGLDQVKGFLGYDESRHNQIMSKLGLNSANVAIIDIQGHSLQLEKEQNYYGGKIFSKEQIKNLCVNYRLKFLSSNLFIGKLDVQIVAKIKDLEKQIAKSMTLDQSNKKGEQAPPCTFKFDDRELQSKFFIMAPPKMFNLEKEKRELGIHRFGKFLDSMIPKDPILFYLIGDDKYAIVHKRGNDFSILRAVKGIIYKNETSLLIWRSLTIMVLVSLLTATFTNLFINGYFGYNILTILAIIVLSVTGTILSLLKSNSVLYSEHGWSQSMK